MLNGKIGFYAFLLETAAWSGSHVLGAHADARLLWYLTLHAGASLLFATFVILLLPARYAKPRRPLWLMLAACGYAVPVLGFVGVLAGVVLLRHFPAPSSEGHFHSLELPEFDPHQHPTGAFRRSGLHGFLGNPSVPVGSRMGALVALQYIPGRISAPLLRDVLTDPSEDLRLLAYGMLDNQEKRINQSIDEEFRRLEQARQKHGNSRLDGQGLTAARRLSDLYWELVYQQLAQGDLRQHALAKSAEYCRLVLAAQPDDPALTLRHGRLQHALGEPEAAAASYYKAMALGLPSTRVLPYLAELRFDQRQFADARRLIGELEHWDSLPRLRPVIAYWSKS